MLPLCAAGCLRAHGCSQQCTRYIQRSAAICAVGASRKKRWCCKATTTSSSSVVGRLGRLYLHARTNVFTVFQHCCGVKRHHCYLFFLYFERPLQFSVPPCPEGYERYGGLVVVVVNIIPTARLAQTGAEYRYTVVYRYLQRCYICCVQQYIFVWYVL